MNDARRKVLDDAIRQLSEAKSRVEEIRGLEEETFEAMPESFQSGERGEKVTAAIDALGEAEEAIDNAVASIEQAKE